MNLNDNFYRASVTPGGNHAPPVHPDTKNATTWWRWWRSRDPSRFRPLHVFNYENLINCRKFRGYFVVNTEFFSWSMNEHRRHIGQDQNLSPVLILQPISILSPLVLPTPTPTSFSHLPILCCVVVIMWVSWTILYLKHGSSMMMNYSLLVIFILFLMFCSYCMMKGATPLYFYARSIRYYLPTPSIW